MRYEVWGWINNSLDHLIMLMQALGECIISNQDCWESSALAIFHWLDMLAVYVIYFRTWVCGPLH